MPSRLNFLVFMKHFSMWDIQQKRILFLYLFYLDNFSNYLIYPYSTHKTDRSLGRKESCEFSGCRNVPFLPDGGAVPPPNQMRGAPREINGDWVWLSRRYCCITPSQRAELWEHTGLPGALEQSSSREWALGESEVRPMVSGMHWTQRSPPL